MRITINYLLAYAAIAVMLTACSEGYKSRLPARGKELKRLSALAKPIKYNADLSSVSYPKGKERILVKRFQEGKVSAVTTDSIFTFLAKDALDTLDVLVINYYPAKTASNATGGFGTKDFRRIYGELEKEVSSFRGARNIFVNRPNADLGRFAEAADWQPDEYYFLERYFVPHPQLGNSFVVLNKYGDYELYLGEHPKEATAKSFIRLYGSYYKRQ